MDLDDCEKFGGTRKVMLDNPFVTLNERGQRLGGYNNVLKYKGNIYIVYSAAKEGVLNFFLGGAMQTTKICKFELR